MKVNLEKIEKNIVSLEIEVDQEKMAEALEKAYQKAAPRITVPGFRKGKAPRMLVEKQIGREYLKQEALDLVVPEAYFDAVKESGIEPIDKPQLEVVQLEEGKPLILKATVEVKPEVELGQYIGLEVQKQEAEITEQELADELENLRTRHAQLVTLEEGQVELRDIAVIDFEGFVDGQAFPGGSGTDYSLELGSGTFIPGYEEQLVGAKVGETRELKVTFPEDYHAATLAGREAVFKTTVKAIKRKELAELNDEFAKDVSEFETLQELKNDILNRLKEAAGKKAENRLKDELVEKAMLASQVEIPEIMIQEKIEYLVQNFSRRLAAQGLNLDDYLKYSSTTLEEIKEEYHPAAEKAVKIDLVLAAIAAKENIQAGEEEIEARIAEMAAHYKSEPEVFKGWLENSGNLENVKKSIIIDKTVDFLQEKAVVK